MLISYGVSLIHLLQLVFDLLISWYLISVANLIKKVVCALNSMFM